MIAHLLDPAYYAVSVYAIPTFLTTLAIFLLGLVVLLRERLSHVSISFFLLTLTVSIWLFGFSCAYSTTDAQIALWWTRVAYLGVPFIAPATYQFTIAMLRLGLRFKLLGWAAWSAAILFSAASLLSDALLTG